MTDSRPLPPDAFADLLVGLDTPDFRAFVADLWRARGWTVERDGPLLRRSKVDAIPGRLTALVIDRPSDAAGEVTDENAAGNGEEVDLVVVARREPRPGGFVADTGAEVHGPDDLYRLAMYGVGRETAETLFREHFDRGVETEQGERPASSIASTRSSRTAGEGEPGASDRASGEDGGPSDGTTARYLPRGLRSRPAAGVALIALLVLVFVVVAGVAGGPISTPFSDDGLPDDAAAGATAGEGLEPEPGAAAAGDVEGRATGEGASRSTAEPNVGSAATEGPDGSDGEHRTTTRERRYIGLSPTCERPPGLVAAIIVGALRNNDPATDDGVRTAWNFSSRESEGSTYENFDRFVSREQFEPLYTHRGVEYTPVHREPDISGHRVTVVGPEGDRHPYLLVLSKQAGGDREGCWLLAGIVPE